MLANIIITAILILIIGCAVTYVIKAKMSGQKCIGCPHSKQCASLKQGLCCSCSNNESTKNN